MGLQRTVKCSCGAIIVQGCNCWSAPTVVMRDACGVCKAKLAQKDKK